MSTALGLRAARGAPVEVEPRGELAVFLAAFSWCAALVHGVVAGPHFEELPLFGALFAGLAALQAGWGVLVFRAPAPRVLLLGLVLNAGVVAVWVVSRTVGLPVGPDAGTPEAVGMVDAAATVNEVALVLAAALLARRRPWMDSVGLAVVARQAALVVLIAGGLAVVVAGHAHG